MRRLFLALLLSPLLAYSQYRSDVFCLDTTKDVSQMKIGSTIIQDTTLILDIKSKISGLSISGTSVLNNDNDSYIRVTLLDKYNYEFLVYENYPVLSDDLTTIISNIALETIALDDITPKCLKICVLNASLKLDVINYSNAPSFEKNNSSNPVEIQKEQVSYIVEKLNDHLEKRNMTWRAGVTSMSKKSFSEKKAMFGGKVPQFYGLENYIGGIFVMPGEYVNSTRSLNSILYVNEWDWRNRHGKNWLTPAKDQYHCESCWAFSSIGAFESYINLYYNQLLNYDLSEQEIVSCANAGLCELGGYLDRALLHIVDSGAVPEECFPYTYSNSSCNKCDNPSDVFSFEQFQEITITDEDSIKRLLFKKPICFGIIPWQHVVVLVGFNQIQSGENYYTINNKLHPITIPSSDPLVGYTAWLIKNSWGTDWGDNGFGYVAMTLSNAYKIYELLGNVTSQVLNDNDIVCSDADGDGLYFWGLGPKPSHCPSWVPDTPDGDDSNINYGSLSVYGIPDVLPSGITIKTPETYSSNSSTSYRIGIVNGGSLTITGTTTLTGSSKIRICEGGTLIVDGGVLQNADITMVPGSSIIVRNNGKINMASGKVFEAPIGVVVNIENGEIN